MIADNQDPSQRPAATTAVTPANLPLGTVALVDQNRKVLASMPATGKVAFAKGNGATKQLTITPYFEASDCTFTKQKFIAATEQTTYIGYIGSGTENVPNVNDTEFHIILSKRDNDERNRMGPWPDITSNFRTGVSSSVKEWAYLAASSLAKNAAKEIPNKDAVGNGPSYVRISVIQNGTAVAGVPTATATFMSKYVQLTADIATWAAGDTITIAGDTYDIAAIDHATFIVTLNYPYRGQTAALLAVAEITDTTDTLYGVKILGVDNEFSPTDFKNYFKNRFEVRVKKGAVPATVTLTTSPKAAEGVGSWQQAKIAERLMKHNTYVRPTLEEMPFNEDLISTEVASGDQFSIVSVNIATNVREFIGIARVLSQIHLYLQLDVDGDLNAGSLGDQLAETVMTTAFATGDLDA